MLTILTDLSDEEDLSLRPFIEMSDKKFEIPSCLRINWYSQCCQHCLCSWVFGANSYLKKVPFSSSLPDVLKKFLIKLARFLIKHLPWMETYVVTKDDCSKLCWREFVWVVHICICQYNTQSYTCTYMSWSIQHHGYWHVCHSHSENHPISGWLSSMPACKGYFFFDPATHSGHSHLASVN